MLTLGGVDGSVLLFDVHAWKLMRQFPEIHDLPVTCIAARPYPVPLKEDEDAYDGIQMHAISASADSQLALLTLTRRVPRRQRQRQRQSGGTSTKSSIIPSLSTLAWVALFLYAIYQIGQETVLLCRDDFGAWYQFGECILHSVLIAHPSRPGILIPPH
uniref:Uncharacterized protein n=1 Tax=Cyclophora tenuis TaxID=216820 RepID=A0A7S1DDR2_CYCTE